MTFNLCRSINGFVIDIIVQLVNAKNQILWEKPLSANLYNEMKMLLSRITWIWSRCNVILTCIIYAFSFNNSRGEPRLSYKGLSVSKFHVKRSPSKQSTSADVSLTSVQRQFNVELTLDWRKTDICQRRLFNGQLWYCEENTAGSGGSAILPNKVFDHPLTSLSLILESSLNMPIWSRMGFSLHPFGPWAG